MSTMRSLITGMLPIGSTTMFPSLALAAASEMRVLQASAVLPLIRTPHEPQMAARQEQRMATEASWSALTWRMPSSTERSGATSTSKVSQRAAWPDSGS